MRHHNYLGFLRQRAALTQKQLAHLLDYASATAVQYCEDGRRPPTIKLALGALVLFGVGPREMFPALYAEVEEAVVRRAADLDQSVRGRSDDTARVHRELLRKMMERAGRHPAV